VSSKINKEISYRGEVLRKLIHLFDSIIPLSLFFIDRQILISVLFPLTVLFVLIDLLRHHNNFIKKTYLYFFGSITRKIEKEHNILTGASYYLIACLLIISFFSNIKIIVSALLIMSVSDSMAAIIGISFGRTSLINGKSLEGSLAFLLTSFIILVIVVPELSLFVSLFIAFLITLVELLSFHQINDNLTIPICSALVINLLL
tara:strand:+ start:157 stop:765 length:609 start_codon:yes stop_codon:yes gene_type:complete